MSLALFLVRTNASAYSRKITLLVDDVHGVAKVAHRKFVYPVGYIMAYRTSLLALWHFAMKAAFSFLNGLVHGVTLVNFLKQILVIFHLFCF